MITLDDMPELVQDWRDGHLLWRDLDGLLLDLLEYHEVESVLSQLPEPLRSQFTASLRDNFDRDTPVEGMIWIDSARGEHPAKAIIVARVRRWLANAD